MNEIIILGFSLVLLLFLFFKGFVKEYNTIDASTYFSKSQTDWLRGVAIVGIIYSHYLSINASWSWQIGFLGIFGVAIFLFLSGYSAMFSFVNKPNYLKKYIPKRLVRLYIPFIIVYIIYSIVLLISGYRFTIWDFVKMPVMSLPRTLNWYLKVQLALYIVFYVIAKFSKKKNNVPLILLPICIIYMIIGMIMGLNFYWYESSFMFPLGMLFALYREKVFNFLNNKYVLKLIISFFVFVLSYLGVFLYGGVLSEIIFVVGFMQFLTMLCVRFKGNSKMSILLGTISIDLYLTHTMVPTFVKLFYSGEINIISYIVTLLIAFFAAFAVSKFSKILSDKLLKNIEKVNKKSI